MWCKESGGVWCKSRHLKRTMPPSPLRGLVVPRRHACRGRPGYSLMTGLARLFLTSISGALVLTDRSRVDTLHMWYKSFNFGAGYCPGSPYRDTSLIKNMPLPYDHHMTLGIVLLSGPTRGVFLLSEERLYWRARISPGGRGLPSRRACRDRPESSDSNSWPALILFSASSNKKCYTIWSY